MEESWNAKTCLSRKWGNQDHNISDTENIQQPYCTPIWDGLSCWGPALAGSTVSSKCPIFKGSDVTKSAFRICSPSGEWLDRDGIPSPTGWTNYTPCLTPEIREIMRRLGSNDDAQTKFNIAANTRILEFIGLSLSLAALLLSLLIFYYFRTLRNSRTRLHRHLFIAMVIQVGIRLIVYTDQAITRSFESEGNTRSTYSSSYDSGSANSSAGGMETNQRSGIDNTPVLCEASYISLEYARTAMFMWMFVEGLFLHNMITVTVFEEKLSPLVYPIIGWILPIPLTVAWAIVTHFHYGTATCWWGYNFTKYFWILEGPRLAVLLVNLAFLLNILRVLVTKLRQSNSSETQQAMKAVKAALVLLPLLGLTNLLNMLDAPLEKSPFQFALWSYTTHLLTSTQGLILAFLYCFRNGEVQVAVRKFIRNRIRGNSTHFIIAKRPVKLSAFNNGSISHHVDDSVGVSSSQTVNMINPPLTKESVLILAPNRNTTTGGAGTTTTTSLSQFSQHCKQNEINCSRESKKANDKLIISEISNEHNPAISTITRIDGNVKDSLIDCSNGQEHVDPNEVKHQDISYEIIHRSTSMLSLQPQCDTVPVKSSSPRCSPVPSSSQDKNENQHISISVSPDFDPDHDLTIDNRGNSMCKVSIKFSTSWQSMKRHISSVFSKSR